MARDVCADDDSAAEYSDGLMPANAMITYFGNVFWPVPTKLLSTCKVDVTYFPFDEQFCLLKFGSWTYDGFQVTYLRIKTKDSLVLCTECMSCHTSIFSALGSY